MLQRLIDSTASLKVDSVNWTYLVLANGKIVLQNFNLVNAKHGSVRALSLQPFVH